MDRWKAGDSSKDCLSDICNPMEPSVIVNDPDLGWMFVACIHIYSFPFPISATNTLLPLTIPPTGRPNHIAWSTGRSYLLSTETPFVAVPSLSPYSVGQIIEMSNSLTALFVCFGPPIFQPQRTFHNNYTTMYLLLYFLFSYLSFAAIFKETDKINKRCFN